MSYLRLRPSLSKCDAEKLVHALISYGKKYCNSPLVSLPSTMIQRLQYVQNSAARVLTRTQKTQHIISILHLLHWLSIKQRITFKVLLLVFKSIKCTGPTYLQELLTPFFLSRLLWSGSSNLRSVPQTKLSGVGDRAFTALGPHCGISSRNH